MSPATREPCGASFLSRERLVVMEDQFQSDGSGVSRRNVAKGLAWAAPVIVVGAAAPAVAASTCQSVATTFDSTWVFASPATGTLVSPTSNKVTTGADGKSYFIAQTTATSTDPATTTATYNVVVQPSSSSASGLREGCTYQVSYDLGAVRPANSPIGRQTLAVQLTSPSGVVVPGSAATYTTSNGPSTSGGQVPYVASGAISRTLSSTSFSFKAVAGTYVFKATFTTPTNKGTSLFADGLGFAAPAFTVV